MNAFTREFSQSLPNNKAQGDNLILLGVMVILWFCRAEKLDKDMWDLVLDQ
jgi:hypothetical protein